MVVLLMAFVSNFCLRRRFDFCHSAFHFSVMHLTTKRMVTTMRAFVIVAVYDFLFHRWALIRPQLDCLCFGHLQYLTVSTALKPDRFCRLDALCRRISATNLSMKHALIVFFVVFLLIFRSFMHMFCYIFFVFVCIRFHFSSTWCTCIVVIACIVKCLFIEAMTNAMRWHQNVYGNFSAR